VVNFTELKAHVAEKEALELFHSRMEDLDETFELDDEDRSVIVDDVKSIDSTDEAFAAFKQKLSVLWKQKTKSFKEEQEKALQEQIEAAVQERLTKLDKSEASEKTEEEVVEEAIENAEVEQEAVANNNGSSTEEELSLREKFKQAFSEDSITIQY
jgi:transcriptional regulator with AAA-type ATPase domain